MKRLTLLTILLVVVGLTAGFAVEPTISLSGSGTLEWGVDLDTMSTGFKNTASASATVTIAGAAASKAGKDGWYGSISISAPSWAWDGAGAITATAPATTATIVGMGGKAVIGVSTAPDLALGFAAAVEADSDAADAVVDNEGTISTDYDGPGTYISYAVTDAIMVGFEIVSRYDYTANVLNEYAGALDVSATFKPVTIKAGVNYGTYKQALYAPDYDDPIYDALGFGVKVSLDTAMVDPWVAFDGQSEAAFAWEVAGGFTLTLMETVTATAAAFFDSGSNLDVSFVFAEPAAKGLVDKLDASLTVYVLDILMPNEWEAKFSAGYDAGKLNPSAYVKYGQPTLVRDGYGNWVVDTANPPFLNAGVSATYDLFETAATSLKVAWDSGNLLLDPLEMGTVTVGVTVTY